MGRSKLLDPWKGNPSAAGMNGRRGIGVETPIQVYSFILERKFDRAIYEPRYEILRLV